jgi:outer membrane protein insertion porin family
MLLGRSISRATTLLIGLTLVGVQSAPIWCAMPAEAAASPAQVPQPHGWLLTPVAPVLDHSVDNLQIAPSKNEGGTETSESDLTVEDVTIEGNRLVPSEDILGVVQTHRGDKFDRDQVMRDLKAVNGMGYFDDRSLQAIPEVSSGGVLLKIRVQENAPVTGFAFQGNSVLSTEDLSKLFNDQLGKPQNLTQLSGAIDKVEDAYHQKGFMLAKVVDVKDDPDGNVGIKVDEGTISDIKIVGNKKTKDFIFKRTIRLKAGDVYNEKTLTADLRKLYGDGYFQDIRRSLAPDPNNPEKYTLKVEVDEKRTGSVGLGGGVDTLTGPFGSFTLSDSNFQGRGQVVSLNAMTGTSIFNGTVNGINNGGSSFLPTGNAVHIYNVSANFVEPHLFGSNVSMGASAFASNYASMMIASSTQRTTGASLTFNKQLTDALSASVSFNAEAVSLAGIGDSLIPATGNVMPQLIVRAEQLGLNGGTIPGAINEAEAVRAAQLKGGVYATISPTLFYDTRDARFDPHKGTFAKITGGPSLGIGNASYGKIGGSVSNYHEITKETTLALNIQGGQAFGAVPQFAQFRLGGWNGMRGFKQFSALGTGTGMLMGSAEIRHRLPLPRGNDKSLGGKVLKYFDKNVRWDMFADYGAVTGNSLVNSLYSESAYGVSVGVGLRINVPMLGLIRLDYGYPILSSISGPIVPRFTLGFGDKF